MSSALRNHPRDSELFAVGCLTLAALTSEPGGSDADRERAAGLRQLLHTEGTVLAAVEGVALHGHATNSRACSAFAQLIYKWAQCDSLSVSHSTHTSKAVVEKGAGATASHCEAKAHV